MRGLVLVFIASLVGSVSVGVSASAIELCTAAYLRGCDSPVGNELCLKKLHACGDYDTIIAAYDAQALAPKPIGHYYMGVSYYGLFVRSRAQSYRCAYVDAGRSQFLAFLDKLITEGNLYNPENVDRVRHGTKLLNRMNQVDDCLQSGFTEDEVRRYVTVYTRTLLRGLFLPGEAKGAVADKVAAVNKTIRGTIGAYLNKAVGLEVGIALRRQAMEVANDLINDITTVYRGENAAQLNFGTARLDIDSEGFVKNSDSNIALEVAPPGSDLKETGDSVPSWFTQTKDVETKLGAALGNVTIDEYEEARIKHAGEADEAIVKALADIDTAQKLLPSPETSSGLTSAINAAKAANSKSNLEDDFRSIQKRRIDGVASAEMCISDAVKQWYCVE